MKISLRAFKELAKLISSESTDTGYNVELIEQSIADEKVIIAVIAHEDQRGDKWTTKFVVSNLGAAKIK